MITVTHYHVSHTNPWEESECLAIFVDEALAQEFKQELEKPEYCHIFGPDDLAVEKKTWYVSESFTEAKEAYLRDRYYTKEEWDAEVKRIKGMQ